MLRARASPIWASRFWHLKHRVCVRGVVSGIRSLTTQTSRKKLICTHLCTFAHTGAFLELYIKFSKSNFKSPITRKKSTKTLKNNYLCTRKCTFSRCILVFLNLRVATRFRDPNYFLYVNKQFKS